MFGWFRAWLQGWGGWFSKKRRDKQEDPNVIRKVYDNAIKSSQIAYTETKNAVSELMAIQLQRTNDLNKVMAEADVLSTNKQGAQVAMQKIINIHKAAGKTKEEIHAITAADPEFMRHSNYHQDVSSTLAEKLKRSEEIEQDVKERQKMIDGHKISLAKMQREHSKLATEKEETISDVNVAKQSELAASRKLSMANDTIGQELNEVRSVRDRIKSRAKIDTELDGTDNAIAEQQYAKFAAEASSNKELDSILDWGTDETKETAAEPSKLPE